MSFASSKFTPTQEQLDILETFKNTRVLKVNAIAGSGKEQPISCIVKTPNGDTRIGDLKIGDSIFGANGKITYVTGVFPQGVKDVYQVTFRDGTSTRCGTDHNWNINTIGMKNKNKFVCMTLREMLKCGVQSKHQAFKMKIPLTKPVEYSAQHLELHPYTLGVFLGDGSFTKSTVHISMHKDDTFIFDKIACLFQKHNGLSIINRLRNTSVNGLQTTLVVNSNNETNPITKLTELIEVWDNKEKAQAIKVLKASMVESKKTKASTQEVGDKVNEKQINNKCPIHNINPKFEYIGLVYLGDVECTCIGRFVPAGLSPEVWRKKAMFYGVLSPEREVLLETAKEREKEIENILTLQTEAIERNRVNGKEDSN